MFVNEPGVVGFVEGAPFFVLLFNMSVHGLCFIVVHKRAGRVATCVRPLILVIVTVLIIIDITVIIIVVINLIGSVRI